MATLQTLDGAPLPWDLLKERSEAYWEWRRREEEPLPSGPGGYPRRFSETAVQAIRMAYEKDVMTYGDVETLFEVTHTTIMDIVKRRSYADIT